MLKKKVNGAWSNISAVKRKTNGSCSDCTSVKKKYNGSWSKVWPSSTFSLSSKLFSEDTYLGGENEMDEAVFQMSAKGTGLNVPSKGGIAYGDKFVKTKSDSFYLYIDQEIVESSKATVEAILLTPTISEYYDWDIIRRYAFTSSRQIKSIRIPSVYSQYSNYVYLYFYISSREFTEDSTTTPSATARIYGMWTDTTKYDLYDPYSQLYICEIVSAQI